MKRTILSSTLALGVLVATEGAATPLVTVDTINELAFTFAGTGESAIEFDITTTIQNSVGWELFTPANVTGTQTQWSVFVRLNHVDGSINAPDLILISGLLNYGAPYNDFVTLAHGSAFDTFSLSVTVDAADPTAGGVGQYSGQASLIHRGASVPIPGTLVLLGLGFAGMGLSRFRR